MVWKLVPERVPRLATAHDSRTTAKKLSHGLEIVKLAPGEYDFGITLEHRNLIAAAPYLCYT